MKSKGNVEIRHGLLKSQGTDFNGHVFYLCDLARKPEQYNSNN